MTLSCPLTSYTHISARVVSLGSPRRGQANKLRTYFATSRRLSGPHNLTAFLALMSAAFFPQLDATLAAGLRISKTHAETLCNGCIRVSKTGFSGKNNPCLPCPPSIKPCTECQHGPAVKIPGSPSLKPWKRIKSWAACCKYNLHSQPSYRADTCSLYARGVQITSTTHQV